VWETRPAAVVPLNRSLRRSGIVLGDDADPSPWPREYLALTDNGAGDHECVRLTNKSAPVYVFLSEASTFERLFPSPDSYLADLRQRVAKWQRIHKGKSDPVMLKHSPVLFHDGRGLRVPRPPMEPPFTAAKLREAGVDTRRFASEYAALLEAVTGVPRRSWRFRYRTLNQAVSLNHSTAARSKKPFLFEGFEMVNGDLSLRVRSTDPDTKFGNHKPAGKLDASLIDWPAFNAALVGLFGVVMRTPVRLKPDKVRVSKPTSYGYTLFKCKYALLPG
jgi:hypothetical protein